MTKTLLVASMKLRDCLNPWMLVLEPASAVVASMMRSRWQVFCRARNLERTKVY